MANKEFLLSVTQRIFSNWTALKMAVEYGMGPRQSAEEFCPYMTEIFYMNDNLDSGEVAEELENYMDTQFNTEMEDDSAVQVAQELLRFFQYCKQGDEVTAKAELDKLPPLQNWLLRQEPNKPARSSSTQVNSASSSESEEEQGDKMEVDDGWTAVKTRRKQK